MAVGSAIVGGIGLAKGIFDTVAGGIEKKRAREGMEDLKASRQPVTNPYAQLRPSTVGGVFAGQQNLRSEATQMGALAQGGGRGLSYVPQVARQTALGNQQIAGDFDRQQKEIDQLMARGEVLKAQMLERRYEQEAAGFAQQYAGGSQQMQGGINQIANTAASGFAQGGAFSGLMGGGGARPLASPISGSTMGMQPMQGFQQVNIPLQGVQPMQTTGFQPLIIK